MKGIYAIENEQRVASWLEHHPEAKTALQHIPGAVAEFFPDADLRLEVRADPESTSDERLGVYIRTRMDSERAVEQLVALDTEWGDRLYALTDGDLLLNVEAKA